MPQAQPGRPFDFAQALKKLVVSTFVVFTFVAYAIHDRLSGADGSIVAALTLSTPTTQSQSLSQSRSAPGRNSGQNSVGSAAPVQSAPTNTQPSTALPQPSDTSAPASPTTASEIVYSDILTRAQRELGNKTIFMLTDRNAMVNSFEETLQRMGVSHDHIKMDFFPGFA